MKRVSVVRVEIERVNGSFGLGEVVAHGNCKFKRLARDFVGTDIWRLIGGTRATIGLGGIVDNSATCEPNQAHDRGQRVKDPLHTPSGLCDGQALVNGVKLAQPRFRPDRAKETFDPGPAWLECEASSR